jgi:hypothetical protein
LNTSSGEPEVPPIKIPSTSALDHLTLLVFEIQHEMEDMKFSMEMMNQHISWLVALHANEALKRPTSELPTQDSILLHVPIPLSMNVQSSSLNEHVSSSAS